MNQEEAAAVLKDAEFGSTYWRRRLVRQGAMFAVVLAGMLLFRMMSWPRSTAAFMGAWFFLQLATEPYPPSAPPTPLWRRLAVAAFFGVFGWWALSDL